MPRRYLLPKPFPEGADCGRLKVRNWTDILALGTLFTMAIAGVAWGLKLEARVDRVESAHLDLTSRISANEAVIRQGMLPLTASRVSELQRQIDAINTDLRLLHQRDIEITDRMDAMTRKWRKND